jgi:hypothetical protein
MQFFEVVGLMGAQFGSPQLAPRASGACTLQFDGVTVSFTHDELHDAIELRAFLGRIDPNAPEALGALLAANRLGDGTGASGLSCDASGRVGLRQRMSLAALSPEQFLSGLARFVTWAEHWQGQLAPGVAA